MTAKVNKTDSDCGLVSLRTSAVSGVYASIVFALKLVQINIISACTFSVTSHVAQLNVGFGRLES